MIELVTIETKGFYLPGIINIPQQPIAKACPCIITIYGLGGDRVDINRSGVKLAASLEAAGFYVARFDLRGSGISDVSSEEMTVATHVEDIKTVLDFLSTFPGIDNQYFILLGFSRGAEQALCITNQDKRVKKLILWSPMLGNFGTREQLVEPPKRNIIRHSISKRIVVPSDLGIWLGLNYFLEQRNYNFVQELYSNTKKIFCVFAGDDYFVDINFWINYISIQKEIDYVIISETNHTFSTAAGLKQAIESTLLWLLKAL